MKQKTIYHSKSKVFSALEKAANNLDFEIEESNLRNGTLSFYSSGGLLSFGNRIDITIVSFGSTKSTVKVHSRSAAAIQLVDWGTNGNIETDIIDELLNILS